MPTTAHVACASGDIGLRVPPRGPAWRWIRAILLLCLLAPLAQAPALADTLSVTALNDKPGPVDIVVDGWDAAGAPLFSATLTWAADNNLFSAQTLTIPSATRRLRLTFIHDFFVCCDPDDDRNAEIDFFTIDGNLREAEDFDRTGGTDPAFPGCGSTIIFGRRVADCGNRNDFVEYDLFFFKEPHPNYAPSGMPDFDQKQDQWAHEILCGANLVPDSVPGGDDVPLVAVCASPDEPVIGKGPNNLMETPLLGDDFYRYDYCVPVSVANCLWWFDSKFETDTGALPCDGSDTYPLVTAYSPLPGADDHCDLNVDDPSTPAGPSVPDPSVAAGELVEDLAFRMDTGGQRTGTPGAHGTTAADTEAAVRQYLRERGLADEYIVNLVQFPAYDFVAREVKRSQDIILLISFYQNCSGLQYIGGHAVTVAGVIPDIGQPEVCVSDPFFDLAEAGSRGREAPPGPHPHAGPPETLHNDALFVSHDCYPIGPPGGPGLFGLASYGTVVPPGDPGEGTDCQDIVNFFGQNSWDPGDPLFETFPCDPACPVETEVSFALEISPFFWKSSAFDIDYAPSGVPDFDQKQGPFVCAHDPLMAWSYCGPTAVANSFWWFDSKFEPFPAPPDPGIDNDGYPLVSSFGPWDDHWQDNVEPLIADLAFKMNTDAQNPTPFPSRGLFCGTYVEDMRVAIEDHLLATGLQFDYFVDLVRAPTFDFVAREVERSQDVILLLGFWQQQDFGGGLVWVRIGGHYVTVAGVDRENDLIAFSDPFRDNAEGGGSGRVLGLLPHIHGGPAETYHNDAENVSHDIYTAVPTSSPGGIWGPQDYAPLPGPFLDNFIGQNSSDEIDAEEPPVGPPAGPEPIFTEVEFALEVSPCGPDQDGDGVTFCDGDCDDGNPDVFPGNTESCDGVDNDCDTLIDEDFPALGAGCSAGTGECFRTGVVVCAAGGGGTTCSAVPGTPTSEICDGLDNDCDGQVDEDFLPDGMRLAVDYGAAAGAADLTWTGGQPTFEVYASLDPATIVDPSNSQGTTAVRAWTHGPGPSPGTAYFYQITSPCVLTCPEVCDGVDNDCDGTVDGPGSEQSCSVSNATPVCTGGACGVGSCNPGFDDCDGSPANGCETNTNSDLGNCGFCGNVCPGFPNVATTCVVGICGTGACLPGFEDCDGNPANGCEVNIDSNPNQCGACGNVCPSFPNASKTCTSGVCGMGPCFPGFDNCDGNPANGCEVDLDTDENNCGTCGTVCSAPGGTPVCTGGICGVASCDPGFEDCDGNPTNGCEVDLLNDVTNCGTCGLVCSLPNAEPGCTGGDCTIAACDPDFHDIDGDPGNGCEYFCVIQSPTDLPDPAFKDSNCDGIDGEVARGVFVSTSGSDGNPGTQQQPVRTITRGLLLSSATGRNQVLVRTGTYSESQLILKNAVGIYGNYSPDYTARTTSLTATEFQSSNPTAVRAIGLSSTTEIQFLFINGGGTSSPGVSAYGIYAISSPGLRVRSCLVRAGPGGVGSNGSSPGGTGAGGGPGSLGQPGCEDSNLFCSSCSRPQGGNPGSSACGRSGGKGGSAGHESSSGFFGNAGVGGTPGGPGTPDGHANWNTPPTYWGQDGANGAQGTNGSAGAPLYFSTGYVPGNASGGNTGAPGDGGGGGGGGGGGTSSCDSYGGGGGGGGAGGCGGSGAGPGGSAGGSFAIYLWSSSARIEDCTLITSSGGQGGNGGTGQPGGSGGNGAVCGGSSSGKGNCYGGAGEQDDGSNGGRGGDGGDGGRGGHGGGGAGGPSIGIVSGGGSDPLVLGVSFTLGGGGGGGSSSGNPGPNGLSTSVHTP